MLSGKRLLLSLILVALILNLFMFPILFLWQEDGRCQQYAAWTQDVINSVGASDSNASWGVIGITGPCMTSDVPPTVVYEVTRGSCAEATRAVAVRLESISKMAPERRRIGKCYSSEDGQPRFEVWNSTVEVS